MTGISVHPNHVARDPIRMTLELGLVRNRVIVEYGTDPGGGRPTVTVEDTAQITEYGLREATYTTDLAIEADAAAHAAYLLAALDPAWTMTGTTILMSTTEDTTTADVASIEQGGTLTVPALLPGAPVEEYSAIVLGYSENVSATDWRIEFHLGPTNAPLPGSI